MLYIAIAVYLLVAVSLSILLWAALVAAKWDDSEKEKNLTAIRFRLFSANGD